MKVLDKNKNLIFEDDIVILETLEKKIVFKDMEDKKDLEFIVYGKV